MKMACFLGYCNEVILELHIWMATSKEDTPYLLPPLHLTKLSSYLVAHHASHKLSC